MPFSRSAEENSRKLAQFGQDTVRQNLAGFYVALTTDIVGRVIEFEIEFLCGGIEDLDGFTHDLRTGAVATDDCNIVAFHEKPVLACVMAGSEDAKDLRRSCKEFCYFRY